MKHAPLIICAAILLSAPMHLAAQAAQPQGAAAAAQEKLSQAEELFKAGQYEQARDLVSTSVADYEARAAAAPTAVKVRLYVLQALIAYAFRDEGYAAQVDQSLLKGLQLDLDLDLGNPAEIPPFIQERFAKLKADELARYSRGARRSTVGLFGALVLEPTVLQNPSLLQPGLSYGFNLNDNFTLNAEVRFPLQIPLPIRGQIGLLYYPTFRVERVSTGISLYYVFSLDQLQLTTYTHSLSFGGRMDYLSRSGFGIGGNVEIARADLTIVAGSVAAPPAYTTLPVFGPVRIAFANITIHAYYAF
jgi:hypothetical protein